MQKARHAMTLLPDFGVRFKGLHAYLGMIAGYHDAFASRSMPMVQRFECVSFAVFFLRHWNRWLDSSADCSVATNGISYQAVTDIEISAGALFTIASWLCDDGSYFNGDVRRDFDPQRLVSCLHCPQLL
jgi:hypothetical protein